MNIFFKNFILLTLCLLTYSSYSSGATNNVPDLRHLIHRSILKHLTSLPTDYEDARKKHQLYRDLELIPKPIFDFHKFDRQTIDNFIWHSTPPCEAHSIKNGFDPRKKIALHFASENELIITESCSSEMRCLNVETGEECSLPEKLETEESNTNALYILPAPARPSILKPRPIKKITVASQNNILYTLSTTEPIKASCLSTKYKRIAIACADGKIVIGRKQSYAGSLMYHIVNSALHTTLQNVSAIAVALCNGQAQLFTRLSSQEKMLCIQTLIKADALQHNIQYPIELSLFTEESHVFSDSIKKLNEQMHKQNIIKHLVRLKEKSRPRSAKRTPTKSSEKSPSKHQRR